MCTLSRLAVRTCQSAKLMKPLRAYMHDSACVLNCVYRTVSCESSNRSLSYHCLWTTINHEAHFLAALPPLHQKSWSCTPLIFASPTRWIVMNSSRGLLRKTLLSGLFLGRIVVSSSDSFVLSRDIEIVSWTLGSVTDQGGVATIILCGFTSHDHDLRINRLCCACISPRSWLERGMVTTAAFPWSKVWNLSPNKVYGRPPRQSYTGQTT